MREVFRDVHIILLSYSLERGRGVGGLGYSMNIARKRGEGEGGGGLQLCNITLLSFGLGKCAAQVYIKPGLQAEKNKITINTNGL